MILLEFSMYPTNKGASVSDDVTRSLEIIDVRAGDGGRLDAEVETPRRKTGRDLAT